MTQRVNTPKCVWLAKGVIALMLLIRGNDVYADLIVSNIAGTDGLNYGGIGIWAQSFTTDAQLYRLDDIKLKVSATSSASGIAVAIWSNDAGASTPDTILGSFDIPSLPSSDFDIIAFLPSTEVLLYPSTTYWITTTHSSVYDFQFKGTADTFTSPGVMGRGLLHSTDGGLSWPVGAPVVYMKLEVNGTVVPTPTAVILGTLGLSTAATRLRRRHIPE